MILLMNLTVDMTIEDWVTPRWWW